MEMEATGQGEGDLDDVRCGKFEIAFEFVEGRGMAETRKPVP